MGTGSCGAILFRVSAVLKACWTETGAPSPTVQHGAITTKLSLALETPPLEAMTLAEPPPTAVSTADWPLLWIEITLLLLVLQETTRLVSAAPAEEYGVAVTLSVCPRLSVMLLPLDAPDQAMLVTGACTTGPPEEVYCSIPPSKVCCVTPEARVMASPVGRPSDPAGPL